MSPGVAGSLRQQRALPSAASRAVGSEWVFCFEEGFVVVCVHVGV